MGDLVRAWRGDYYERILRLDQSVEKWYRVQDSYVDGLGDVCEQFGIDLPKDVRVETARAWQRLEAWPDVRPGLNELRSQAVVATLSNTDMATMIALFRDQQLEADAILTAELFAPSNPNVSCTSAPAGIWASIPSGPRWSRRIPTICGPPAKSD